MTEQTLTVEGIGKRYGGRTALHDVSFTAGPGEVIALLGRNGAGKSTLMNIMTGYLAMTEGRVTVCGHDVQLSPMAARRHVGYLPEQPPIYPEMTVREYLRHCARLKGLQKPDAEIDRVIDAASLEAYASRLSGRLSKGYRQRLGLAQALLGAPALLVLDEPGNGLDPVQTAHMRDLVARAGQQCTVLLSSHLLSEVTEVCSRALVIEQGALRFDGEMRRLSQNTEGLRVTWRGAKDNEGLQTALAALPGVLSARFEAGVEAFATLHTLPGADLRGRVFRLFENSGAELTELVPLHERPEDAFLKLLEEEKA